MPDIASPLAADARFWDGIARKYARDPIKDMAGYERTLARTRELIEGAGAVLEIGCGTASTALRLAPSVARLVATDVSPEMIAISREKTAAAGIANLELAVAPADRSPGEAGAFDAVLAFNLLHLVPDRRAVLADIRRLLKPGRLFVSKTACIAEMNPLIRLALPLARALGKAPHVGVFGARALMEEIEAAGFRIVEHGRHGSGRRDPRIFLVAEKV